MKVIFETKSKSELIEKIIELSKDKDEYLLIRPYKYGKYDCLELPTITVYNDEETREGLNRLFSDNEKEPFTISQRQFVNCKGNKKNKFVDYGEGKTYLGYLISQFLGYFSWKKNRRIRKEEYTTTTK